jgi:hypothetical protein
MCTNYKFDIKGRLSFTVKIETFLRPRLILINGSQWELLKITNNLLIRAIVIPTLVIPIIIIKNIAKHRRALNSFEESK